jgi:hypothetical protein
MDNNLQLTEVIHSTVSITKEYSLKLDDVLKTEADVFEIPREALESLKNVIDTNVYLVTKLFEENQSLNDGIENALKKGRP